MFARMFRPGDVVVYRKQKSSTSPGPRAKDVSPHPKGEDYTYCVDKYWLVVDAAEDGTLRLRTRRGKEHQVHKADANLRRPRWWERLWMRVRFQRLREAQGE